MINPHIDSYGRPLLTSAVHKINFEAAQAAGDRVQMRVSLAAGRRMEARENAAAAANAANRS